MPSLDFCRGSLVAFTLSRSQGKKFLGVVGHSKKFGGTHTVPDMVVVLSLHVLELVHPPLCVALPHLPQGLVLVPALLHILLVDLVHRRLRLVKTKSHSNSPRYMQAWTKTT